MPETKDPTPIERPSTAVESADIAGLVTKCANGSEDPKNPLAHSKAPQIRAK